MKRLAIITVGKTHSGKTTFAHQLEKQLQRAVVIDQDNHAEFVNAYYKSLRPVKGPNTLKYAITNTIVDYAVRMTDAHLIMSNSNRNKKGRLELLRYFREQQFESVLVHFDLPDSLLQERTLESGRSKAIFRTASSFTEVLNRQIAETGQGDVQDPQEDEADHLLIIQHPSEVPAIMRSIVALGNT